MKKVSIFVLSCVCLICVFVGCKAQDSSTVAPNVAVPSIMLDDVLYSLDGNGKITVEIDESDFLGRVTSTVPITKLPTENGQANIPVEDAPYAKYSDGIVVLWNEEWQLFKARTEQSENPSDSETKKQQEADYKGLTKEEYEDLQAQKARYEAMTDEQKQIAREGGTVGCKKFVHLWWEETISNEMIDYVGSDRFSEWITEHKDSDGCLDIYSFADKFDIDLNTMKTIISENYLEEFYPLDRLETRFNYFLNRTQPTSIEEVADRAVKYYPDKVSFQFVRQDKIYDESHQDSFVDQECYIFDVTYNGKLVSSVAVGIDNGSLWFRDMNSDKLWLSESFMGLNIDNDTEVVKAEPIIQITSPNVLYFARLDTIPELSNLNEGFAGWNESEKTLTINAVKNTGTVTGAMDGPHVKAIVTWNDGEPELTSVEYQAAPTFSRPSQVLSSGEMLNIEPDRLIEIAEYFRNLIDEYQKE